MYSFPNTGAKSCYKINHLEYESILYNSTEPLVDWTCRAYLQNQAILC